MATFKERVEGVTGITISDSATNPTEAELTEYLADGVIDITSKWTALKPQDSYLFQRVSSEAVIQGGLKIDCSKIISVIRENGNSEQWRECKPISLGLQYTVTDKSSMYYASKYNPAFLVLDDGTVNVYPTPGTDPNAYKIYYVNHDPVETDGTTLEYSSTGIRYFPSDKEYLVIIYASMRALQNAMAGLSNNTLVSNAITSAQNLLDEVDDEIIIAKGKIDDFYTSIGDLDDETELWDDTNKRYKEVRDSLDKAKLLIDGVTIDGDTEPETVQFWLNDEDSEMAQATLAASAQEIGRANAVIGEINALMQVYGADLQGVQPYLSISQTYLSDAQGHLTYVQTKMADLKQEYEWYNIKWQQLKNEYNEAFTVITPKPQVAPE